MLHFFRKMRKALIPESRFGRYFFYALGEIVLVVIGILIALQVNNWNEERKLRIVEQNILVQLNAELGADIQMLHEVNFKNWNVVQSCEILLKHLKEDLPYHDSLSLHFDRWAKMSPLPFNKSAFQSLTARGTELIRNQDLRFAILNLYNNSFNTANEFNNYWKTDYQNFLAPIQLENVESIEWLKKGVPFDYENLKSNNKYINALHWAKNGHRLNAWQIESVIDEITETREDISLELKSF